MKKKSLLMIVTFLCNSLITTSHAQTAGDFMKAMAKANIVVPFDVTAPGTEYKVNWGMDAAWDWDFNVNRGVAHIGKGNFATGRVSFQPNDLVTDNGDGTYELTARQKTKLKWRCDLMKLTGTTQVNINCDHEALADDNWAGRTNYQGKPQEWYKLIKASVAYVKTQGLEVISISPFNEPDYVWQQAKNENQAMADFLSIAQLLKADSYFDGIRICGGNTLNSDRALPWYNYLTSSIDEGNTHQLAGSFANYANFFTQVRNDGRQATADELHNVGEAMVGVNYGMQNGIWWGFDSKARGQFCIDSNDGVRLGYGEDRDRWTDAAIYRNNTTGEIHGYFGSSERQGAATDIQYISTKKDVFFNGYGPTRSFVYKVPGLPLGQSGYQYGQINAERLFDVTWGEDVAPSEVDGTYIIMNAYSRMVITSNGTSPLLSSRLLSSGSTQQWKVTPVYTDFAGEVKYDDEGKAYISYGEGVHGDVSYWFIDNAKTTTNHWNVLNNSTSAGTSVICFNAGHDINEQWYLKYAQDGYYFIISRLSNKYLYCSASTTGTQLSLQDAPTANATTNTLKKYLWRFQPTDSKAETTAPKVATDIYARQRPGSIQLFWTAPTDNDPITFTILREADGEWNTIGRNISGDSFIDNTVVAGKTYRYKVRTVDYAGNRSKDSDILTATTLNKKALLCQLQFDKDLSDQTANSLGATASPQASYSANNAFRQSGVNALNMTSQNSYVQVPYNFTHQPSMTIAMWVRWSGGNNWQRVFDFGNDTDHYMFLTPSNGSEMRFVLKNGGSEEVLSADRLPQNSYRHVAITIQATDAGSTSVTLYVNGEAVATKSDFTINPADIQASVAYLGRSMFIADPLFKGYLDDFRIYNYPLTADEILTVMEDTGATSIDVKDDYEDTPTTGIQSVAADVDEQSDGPTYNTAGQQVQPDYRGVVIRSGRKILNR